MSARRYEDLFRRAYEGYAVIAWSAGAVFLLISRPPWWYVMAPVLLLVAILRALQVKRLWSFRLSLSLSRMRTITLADLMERSRKQRKRGMLSLGRGFIWSQRHAEVAHQILNRNADELPDLPGFVREAMQELENKRIRPANPSTRNEPLQAPSCPRQPSWTPCLKKLPIRTTRAYASAASTARNSRLN